MFSIPRIVVTLLLSISLFSGVMAQTGRPNAQTSNPIVTATTSNGRVRYASLGEVNQTRLQVFSPDGRQVYDSDLRLGNLIDWPLQDQEGQPLTDGSYLFLITVKEFSGVLTQKYGTALLESGQVTLQQAMRDELSPAQALALQANKLSEVLSSVDRIGAAALSVRPTASNDVAPVIDLVPPAKQKTTTFQPTPVVENVTGTGSQHRVAKWTETGGAGTLGDTQITESNGNVVVGNSSLTGNIQVYGTALQDVFAGMGPDLNVGPAFNYGYAGGTFGRGAGFFNVRPDASATPPNPSLRFMTANIERMIVTNAGNVGVGTNNPQSRLDVNGDLNVTGSAVISGNIAAKYQDVAEWVQARLPMEAGTVVSLDATRTNGVTASRHAYDGLIAGVVSAQPGVILGEASADKVMVTMSGRVMVKVDAGKYPIRIGDLLVASNKPGVAMRSRPIRVGNRLIHRPGTIIGKALEALPGGEGNILVLVSLQ